MEIKFQKRFLKDLASVTSKSRLTIENLVFNELNTAEQITESEKLFKLKGFKSYYRIRIGEYRIGIKIENDIISFERVLHRKEIYKYFP